MTKHGTILSIEHTGDGKQTGTVSNESPPPEEYSFIFNGEDKKVGDEVDYVVAIGLALDP